MKKLILLGALYVLVHIPYEQYLPVASVASPVPVEKKSLIKPQIFSEGIISTDEDEFGCTFSSDGNTMYFCKKSPSTLRSAVVVICSSEFKNGKWQTPQVAPFSGTYKDFNPSLSPDGSTLYFISNRPVSGKPAVDIWFVKKTLEGWSEPENIGAPVNSDALELGCSIASDGTIYFSSTRDNKSLDIYRSRFVNGQYQEPENLGDAINSAAEETDPFIAPDQSYLLFSSTGRDDAINESGAIYPRADLYISFQKDGKWTPAQHLDEPINSAAEESNPFVSGDGKTLFFTSERNFVNMPMQKTFNYSELEKNLHQAGNGLGDIYEVPFNQITKE